MKWQCCCKEKRLWLNIRYTYEGSVIVALSKWKISVTFTCQYLPYFQGCNFSIVLARLLNGLSRVPPIDRLTSRQGSEAQIRPDSSLLFLHLCPASDHLKAMQCIVCTLPYCFEKTGELRKTILFCPRKLEVRPCLPRLWPFLRQQASVVKGNDAAISILGKGKILRTPFFSKGVITRSSWLNCALWDDETMYWVSIGHYEAVAVDNWWYWVSRGHLCYAVIYCTK